MSPRYNTSRDDFAPLLSELDVALEELHLVDPAEPGEDLAAERPGPGSVLVSQIGNAPNIPAAVAAYRERVEGRLAPGGATLLYLKDQRSPEELARWRNALWPWLHVGALVYVTGEGVRAKTPSGGSTLPVSLTRRGVVIFCRRREHVLSPEATVEKFDKNAGGWNAQPGSPGYGHFRWMRRLVGRYAPAPSTAPSGAPGTRILDFGCGAGWVGIEAALAVHDPVLRLFDPSPELARAAEANARAAGIPDLEARTGFGDDPPFPGPGEAPFDLVLSSGVVSFAPDQERFFAGLLGTVAQGGTLVIGDVNPESRGMRSRRRKKPLLFARELNALAPAAVRERIERDGFTFLRGSGYQLTWPVPQLAHLSDTRLGGLASWPLLQANRAAAGLDRSLGGRLGGAFDSWVLAFTRRP